MATIEIAPVWQAVTHQALFRRILDATARPGIVADLGSLLGAADAALGTLAVFCDASQTLADLTSGLGESEWRFLGAKPCCPETARFILADGTKEPGAWTPCRGSLEAPDLGTMIVLRVQQLSQGFPLFLSGPGISGKRQLPVTGLHSGWLAAREHWCAAFPLGCDIVLADAARIAVLPRTTLIAKG